MRLVDVDDFCFTYCAKHGLCNKYERSVCMVSKMRLSFDVYKVLDQMELLKDECKTQGEVEMITKCEELLMNE